MNFEGSGLRSSPIATPCCVDAFIPPSQIPDTRHQDKHTFIYHSSEWFSSYSNNGFWKATAMMFKVWIAKAMMPLGNWHSWYNQLDHSEKDFDCRQWAVAFGSSRWVFLSFLVKHIGTWGRWSPKNLAIISDNHSRVWFDMSEAGLSVPSSEKRTLLVFLLSDGTRATKSS